MVALVVGPVVLGVLSPLRAVAGPCDWEWGGVAEATPTPCPTPVGVELVDPDTGGDGFNAFRGEFLVGVGLLVLVSTASLVYSWGRRR